MKTLGLTSPHTKGKQVEFAQNRLKSNHFNQDYLQGVVDGEFGPETARGCKRAKYWLGFTTANQRDTYGKFLDQYLSGERKLTKKMQIKRAERLKKKIETPLRMLALAEMRKDIGMKEQPPGSNRVPTSEWWGLIAAWCAMQVSKAYINAGSVSFRKGVNWAYVPYLLQAAVRGDHNLSLTRSPKIGDIVTFDWDNDGIPDHVGVMASTISDGGYFETIEGNTAVGNDSNGGQVMERNRNISDVATYSGRPVFIHVGK
jgi:hypothetical protein